MKSASLSNFSRELRLNNLRILLVCLHDVLPFAITNVLNPANEYCAIVTDEVEPVKNFLPDAKNLIYPFHEFKYCVDNFYYDVVLFASDLRTTYTITDELKKYNIPQEKFFIAHLSADFHSPFLLDRAMRYYKKYHKDFDAFATGMSYVEVGIDYNQFRRKIFNFAYSSQDLYYDYQTAKFAISRGGI